MATLDPDIERSLELGHQPAGPARVADESAEPGGNTARAAGHGDPRPAVRRGSRPCPPAGDGVRVTSLHLDDLFHGLLVMGRLVRTSNVAVDFVSSPIGEALHHGSPA